MFNVNNFNPNAGNNIPKVLNPGSHIARIVNLYLDTPPFDKNALFVNTVIEGQPQPEGFEGILIDKENPSKGRYQGQIATVKSGRFAFSTFTYQGREIQRDEQVFKFIMNLATQLNVLDAVQKANINVSTIGEFVEVVKPYLINNWAFFTIAGQEYYAEGYDKPNYRLFFPKPSKGNFPFSALKDENKVIQKFIKFNADDHILIAKKEDHTETVDSFAPADTLFTSSTPPVESNNLFGAPASQPAPAAPAQEDDLDLPF
jgi:hypothetical protein